MSKSLLLCPEDETSSLALVRQFISAETASIHPTQRFIPVERAAKLLGCSGLTIRRRIRERRFPALKIGSKAVVPLLFIERILADTMAGKTVVLDEYVDSWLREAHDS